MEEWKEYKLGDVSTFSQGIQVDIDKQYSDYKPGRVRFIRIVDFTKSGEPQRYIDKPRDKCLTGDGDIVMIRYGSQTAGIVAKSYDGAIANNIFKIEFNNDVISNEFGYYYLSQKSIFDYLRGAQSSSTMPAITFEIAGRVPLCLPTINIQNDIVSILKSLDDKIEVNRKINENLEQEAQALFKSWFVDFEPFKNGEFVESELGMIPKGWRVCRADEVFDINIGKTPPRKEPEWFTKNTSDNIWVSIADMGSCGMFVSESSEYLTNEAINRFNILMVDEGSVLLSFKLTVGRVAIADTRLTTNEAIARFQLPQSYYREFLYLYLKQYKYGNLGSTSSIATAVNSKTIKGMKLITPPEEVISCFSKHTKPLFDKIKVLSQESRRLAELRDTLLPKLMSGELKVNEIEDVL